MAARTAHVHPNLARGALRCETKFFGFKTRKRIAYLQICTNTIVESNRHTKFKCADMMKIRLGTHYTIYVMNNGNVWCIRNELGRCIQMTKSKYTINWQHENTSTTSTERMCHQSFAKEQTTESSHVWLHGTTDGQEQERYWHLGTPKKSWFNMTPFI